jgi:hypothetical protein
MSDWFKDREGQKKSYQQQLIALGTKQWVFI